MAIGINLGMVSAAWSAELKKLDITYQRFHQSNIIPEMYPHKAKEGLSLGFDVSLYGPFYWNNVVHALTDAGQYRLIGWQFELGVSPWQSLDLFYIHHSQHLLDSHHPFVKFPVNDSLGLRWRLFTNENGGGR